MNIFPENFIKHFKKNCLLICSLSLVIFCNSCTKVVGKPPLDAQQHRFPGNIANILVTKCATSGCHNSKSMEVAAGLNFESWDKLFKGGNSGAVVIPFSPEFSSLMYYINSFNEYGSIQLTPKMPLNQSPLNKDEVKTIFEWIKGGAPDADGNIKFSGAGKGKFYVANQGCDVVTVFDSETLLASRYVSVGETRGIEAPHMVKVSPDNQHWYVSFIAGGYFLKYRTSDNSLAGKVNLGVGSWNTFVITSDSKKAYVIDFSSPGKIAVVNLETMTSTLHIGYVSPHGSALNKNEDVLYVTAQYGNFIYKFNVNDLQNPTQVSLDGKTPDSNFSLDPHEIIFSPDGSKYFVTCQTTNEIRILQTSNDSLLAVLPVGVLPQEMSISKTTPYLFVTCMDDPHASALKRSSVYVINYQTNQIVTSLYAGFQSHGIAVDDVHKRVYVGNRNILTDGPTPHHQGLCFGRNGYVTAIDLNSLTVIPDFKTEVSIDPYGVGTTH